MAVFQITTQHVHALTGGAEWPEGRYARALFGYVIFKALEQQHDDLWKRTLLAGSITDDDLSRWLKEWRQLPLKDRSLKRLKVLTRKELAGKA